MVVNVSFLAGRNRVKSLLFFFFLPFGYIFVCSISADLKVRFHGKFADTNAWGEAPFHGKQYLVLIFNFAE